MSLCLDLLLSLPLFLSLLPFPCLSLLLSGLRFSLYFLFARLAAKTFPSLDMAFDVSLFWAYACRLEGGAVVRVSHDDVVAATAEL
jgi:hypothetical protein